MLIPWRQEIGSSPSAKTNLKEQIALAFNQGFDRQGDSYQKTIDLHDEPAFRAKDEEEFMARKNLMAIGSFRKEDRSQAIDLLGVQSQLLFPNFRQRSLSLLNTATT